MVDYKPDIVLTVPQSLASDFLGIMALDVLHDAKGRGYLAGHKLEKLTDAIAEMIYIINMEQICRETLQSYVFSHVLRYFAELWKDNIRALGLCQVPNTDQDLLSFKHVAVLPLHHPCDRSEDDVFTGLGTGRGGIEAENYHHQRNKLNEKHVETLSFVSPQGINNAGEFFRQAAGIVDIIKMRTSPTTKVVLDMKASAGLIRTLADPLGYITGLPTYADPGYNMPGMSAIRQHANIAFIEETKEYQYTGSKQFYYQVKLQVPFLEQPLLFLDTLYFYGVGSDGLDRSNLMIRILGEPFLNVLPRSTQMAEALGSYLRGTQHLNLMPRYQELEIVKHVSWNYYDSVLCTPTDTIELYGTYCSKLNFGPLTWQDFVELMPEPESVFEWCKEQHVVRTNYILCTLRNSRYYNVPINDLLPKDMISDVLPQLMYHRVINRDDNFNVLAFCYYQIKLLQQLSQYEDNSTIICALNAQWLPKHRGKLVLQVMGRYAEWRKKIASATENDRFYVEEYLQQLLNVCRQTLGSIANIDFTETNAHIDNFLNGLPIFKPSNILVTVLTEYLYLYYPEMYHKSAGINRGGLLLAIFLEIILAKRPLFVPGLNLRLLDSIIINDKADQIREAMWMILGKFNGDFGQIMWSICNGHLFASEDNNTSAMALMLHRLGDNNVCIEGRQNKVWGNIHGLGDGSCVDVTIHREIDFGRIA